MIKTLIKNISIKYTDVCKELKCLFLLCNNLQATMSKYPSEIITDTSIDKYLTDDAFANLRVPAYDNDIINKVLYYASQFLSMEKSYNNGAYNFGLIPYYYAQKFINSQSSLHETFNDLVNEYIDNVFINMNTINIVKVKILFVQILAVLTDNINNKDITSVINDILVNKLPEIKTIQHVIDTYDITAKDGFRVETFLDYVCKIVVNMYYNGKNPDYLMIRVYAVKKWIEMNNISSANILSYKLQLGKYYDLAEYCLTGQTITDEVTNITENIDNMIDDILDTIDGSTLSIPANNNQKVAEMMFKHQYSYKKYLVYIYTSFIIYHVVPNCDDFSNPPETIRIPSLNDYVSSNSRNADCKSATAEFLLSNVYEDIINYAIYNTLVNQSDYYTDESWSDWTHAKQVAYKDVCFYRDNVTVMNISKLFLYLFSTDCHSINDTLMRNVYNIYNIDTRYIIIHNGVTIDFNADIHTIVAGLIDWSSKFYILFKPLKNLRNYYHENKVNNYDTFATIGHNSGDLYSVYNGIFTLIDVKNYDYSDKYNTPAKLRNLYYHTILQTWLYMNAYIKPIGMMNDKRLYDTYHLAVINPYLNDMIVCEYDKVTNFTRDIDLSEYRFNTTM